MFKTFFAVLAIVVLFGGSFVAVNKPFRPWASAAVLGTGLALLGIAYTTGVARMICVGTLIAMLGFSMWARTKR